MIMVLIIYLNHLLIKQIELVLKSKRGLGLEESKEIFKTPLKNKVLVH